MSALFVWVCLALAPARAGVLDQVRLDPQPGAQLPLDAQVVDESGRRVAFGSLLHGEPAILVFAYTRCPMLCPEVLNGLLRSLRAISLTPGKSFRVLAASFDPRDTPARVEARRLDLVRLYGRGPAAGWSYLTGAEGVDRLAKAAGFQAAFDPRIGQYAHGAGFVVLTPQGRVSNAFFGVEYSPRDLRLALIGASGGRIGTWGDRVLFYCYRYDPTTGRYGVAIMRLVRIAGVLTVLGLAAAIFRLSRTG